MRGRGSEVVPVVEDLGECQVKPWIIWHNRDCLLQKLARQCGILELDVEPSKVAISLRLPLIDQKSGLECGHPRARALASLFDTEVVPENGGILLHLAIVQCLLGQSLQLGFGFSLLALVKSCPNRVQGAGIHGTWDGAGRRKPNFAILWVL